MDRNIIFYGALVVVIAAVAYTVLYYGMHGAYDISVGIAHTGTSGLFPYNTTRFVIVLNNTGSSVINGLLVGFYVNGQAYKTYNVTIPEGKVAQIPVNYTYSKPGSYVFEAIADPAHLIGFSNRSLTHDSVSATVGNTVTADPLSSIPDANVSSSRLFQFYGGSIAVASAIDGMYRLNATREIFGPMGGVLSGIANNLYSTFVSVYGADVNYMNGSSAHSVWISGSLYPSIVGSIIQSYGFERNSYGNESMFTSNGLSICVSASGGWTKIVGIAGGDCHLLREANSSLLGTYRSEFRNGSPIMNYTEKFLYTNSTLLGNQFGIFNGSRSASAWFTEGSSGYVFVSSVDYGSNVGNSTCYGLISNGSICSVFLSPYGNATASGSSLILSEERTANYTFSLYSLVNASKEVDANYNAVKLIGALNATGIIPWQSIFRNSCSLNVTDISCTVSSFDSTTMNASIIVSGNASLGVRINSASCFMVSGLQQNQTVNKSVAANGYVQFNVTCMSIPIPVVGAVNSYNLYINYTSGGMPRHAEGFLNITNVV